MAEMEIRASLVLITWSASSAIGHQISKPPFYCQAISFPPPADVADRSRRLGAQSIFRLQDYRNSLSRFEAVSRAQQRPGDPGQLVRKCHDDDVYTGVAAAPR